MAGESPPSPDRRQRPRRASTLSCFSLIARGQRLGEEVTTCLRQVFGRRAIRFPVTSCTGYSDVRHPTLFHMEEIGWVLRSNPKRKTIGFVEARKLAHDDRHVIEED